MNAGAETGHWCPEAGCGGGRRRWRAKAGSRWRASGRAEAGALLLPDYGPRTMAEDGSGNWCCTAVAEGLVSETGR
jgi:hypothetical protein